MLDVSMVINDPLLSDTFDVKRQVESVGSNGRTQKTPELHKDLRGIVISKGNKVTRTEDHELVVHEIEVITSFALRDARFGFQPDIVVWDGIEFLVTEASSYQRLAGHTQAIAESFRASDKPQ